MNNCNDDKLIELIKKNNKCCKPCFGPTGPTGPMGTSETISVGNTITVESGEKAKVIDRKTSKNHTFDFVIPMGPVGPTGPAGPSKIKTSYIISYNDGTSQNGIPVNSLERIPLDRVELDVDNLVTINSDDETLMFNQVGYYKISFIISAMVKKTNGNFDVNKDFVSVGFRLVDTDNIYIGASKWIYNDEYDQITGQGILAVDNIKNIYEFVNIGPEIIYLWTPDLKNIKSNSYFTNALVNIVVEYLGK